MCLLPSALRVIGINIFFLSVVFCARRTRPLVREPPPPLAHGETRSLRAEGRRIPLIDNSKFFFMCLIIAHHSSSIYEWLGVDYPADFFQFHTRAFCFMSGFTASGGGCSARAFRNLVIRLWVPIIIWCTFWRQLVHNIFEPEWWVFSLFDEFFWEAVMNGRNYNDGHLMLIWFLISLFWWRLFGMLLAPLPSWVQLAVALGFNFAGGYVNLSFQSFNQTVACLPIFVAGRLFPLEWTLQVLPQTPAVVCIGLLLLLVAFMLERLESSFMGSLPVWGGCAQQVCGNWIDHLCYFRATCYAMIQMFKVLLLVFFVFPRKELSITKLGERSLYAYLLHLLFVRTLAAAKRKESCECSEGCVLGWPVFFVYVFAINAALSSSWTASVFGVLFQPSWLERLFDEIWVRMYDPTSSSSGTEGASSEVAVDAPSRAVSESEKQGLLGVTPCVELGPARA